MLRVATVGPVRGSLGPATMHEFIRKDRRTYRDRHLPGMNDLASISTCKRIRAIPVAIYRVDVRLVVLTTQTSAGDARRAAFD